MEFWFAANINQIPVVINSRIGNSGSLRCIRIMVSCVLFPEHKVCILSSSESTNKSNVELRLCSKVWKWRFVRIDVRIEGKV